MDELVDKKLDQTDSTNSSNEQVTNKSNLISQEQDDNNKANKSLNSKLASTNGLTKFPSSKTIPLILKRSRLSEKVDCSESNENIDENKELKASSKAPNELVQRSSSRKKIKKTFGSDFLHMDLKQYSSSSLAKSSSNSTATVSSSTTKKSRTKECFYCSTRNGELFFCKICRLKAHENCFLDNLAVIRAGYKNQVVICSNCRECEMCNDKKGSFYFCKRCSSCFHHQCDSNLARYIKPTFGKWQCSFCDTLDNLCGDSLTEEQRKKEITRRKLFAMRKRLRKSDYILENGLCSIQQVVKQAVKKRKKCNDGSITDDNDTSLNSNDKNEIDLSEDELINSKHILNESQKLDIWLDDEIDFLKLEDFLKKERKFNNILSKHIKDDKKYFILVKLFIDQLKDNKFDCKKNNFLKLLNSDQFKKSFFESSSLNGLTKSSTFLEAYTKLFEIKFQNDYWRPDDTEIVNDPINKSDYLTKNVQNKEESDNELNDDLNQNLDLELDKDFKNNETNDEMNKEINGNTNEEDNFELNKEANTNETTNDLNKETDLELNQENIIEETNLNKEANLNEETNLIEENNLIGETNLNEKTKLNQINEESEIEANKNDKKQIVLECNEEFSHDENMIEQLIVKKFSNSKEQLKLNENLSIDQQTIISDNNLDDESIINKEKTETDVNICNKFSNSQKINDNDKVIDLNNDSDKKVTDNNLLINESKDLKQEENDESMHNDLLCKETIDIDTELNNGLSDLVNDVMPIELNKDKLIEESQTNLEPSTSNCKENNLENNLNTKLKIKASSNNLVDKLFKKACKYNLNLLEPKHWSINDVSIYLKQIGFDKEAEYFKAKEVDGKILLNLTRQEVLNNFKLRLGPAVKIAAYLNDLQIKNKCNISFD